MIISVLQLNKAFQSHKHSIQGFEGFNSCAETTQACAMSPTATFEFQALAWNANCCAVATQAAALPYPADTRGQFNAGPTGLQQ
jgi:hypothetical protein